MKSKTPLLHSLARYAIGDVLIAIEEINPRIATLEKEILVEPQSASHDQIRILGSTVPETKDALIGMAFDLEDKFQGGLLLADRFPRWIGHRSVWILRPLASSRLANPITRRFD